MNSIKIPKIQNKITKEMTNLAFNDKIGLFYKIAKTKIRFSVSIYNFPLNKIASIIFSSVGRLFGVIFLKFVVGFFKFW
jgi:hypothetical protein